MCLLSRVHVVMHQQPFTAVDPAGTIIVLPRRLHHTALQQQLHAGTATHNNLNEHVLAYT
jgi:hypothetical protein